MSAIPTFSPSRVTADLSHAWGGIWRLTLQRFRQPTHWLMLAVGLSVLALLLFGGSRGGDAGRLLEWTVTFYLTFLVPVLAFMSAGGVMREELRAGTGDYVLTRPVPRPAFVLFKYLAHTICAQIDFLAAFIMVSGFAAAQGVPGLFGIAVKLLGCQLLLVAAFSGLGFLCGVISARYVVLGLAYGALIEVGVGQIPTQISRLSMTHQVRDLLRPLWSVNADLAAAPGWLGTTATVLLFCVGVLAATATIFSLREHAGSGE